MVVALVIVLVAAVMSGSGFFVVPMGEGEVN